MGGWYCPWDSLSDQNRLEYALKNLATIHGKQVYREFETGASHSWVRYPYSAGAFTMFKPEQATELSPYISTPEGRVHFAGEHTSSICRGTYLFYPRLDPRCNRVRNTCCVWSQWLAKNLLSVLVTNKKEENGVKTHIVDFINKRKKVCPSFMGQTFCYRLFFLFALLSFLLLL